MDKKEKIKILQDIIKIKSVNGNEEEVATYLKKLLGKYDIDSHVVKYSEGRSNLIAYLNKSSDKVLGFSGHMDVVSSGDETSWDYPPFDAHIEGNKLYGRGSTDMKSGLAAMVIAMIELKERNVHLQGAIKLLATAGEEIGEVGSEQLTKEGYVDDLNGLIIGEPSNYNLMYTHMGSINYSVTSYGKEAHSSMPKKGINAINHLTDFINVVNKEMLEISARYTNEELGSTIHNVTVINGGDQVNSIPGKAHLEGNIRTIPEFNNDQIILLLNGIISELNKKETYHLELKIDYNKISVRTNKDSELIKCIEKVFDNKLPLSGISATTDAAEFTKSLNDFDFIIFGPGVTNLPHQVNEYVEIDNYLDMIEKYQDIAKEYLK
ncbi:ArgE/DapE family deacylase [Enterococcus gilvus]|uniref:ArgE/DapE family deacylase n=1 Tax=Enterococcus gilvus TaxID=160453 RepID=UPI003D6C3665